MSESAVHPSPIRFPWLLWLAALAALLAINAVTQPFEDELSLVPPAKAYYLDIIWYLDDIVGPSLFLIAGLLLLWQTRLSVSLWAVTGLGLCCLFFALGDTMDIHWVLPSSTIEYEGDAVSFSSWITKVMVVITYCFFMIHAYDQFPRAARKCMLFAFLLLYIDQIQMSISFDFAGYYFHVFEESLEVVTASFLAFGVARQRIIR